MIIKQDSNSNEKRLKKNGADIILDYLIAEGVPYAFGLSGHGNVGLLDSLYKNSEEIKTIAVRHESAAGFMADAYFKVKHSPVVVFASCGPGAANLPVSLAAAYADSSAMLAITGNVPTSQFNRSPFQESGAHYQADFPSVIKPYVKRSYQPTRTDMVPLAIRQAYKEMVTGKPGPVNLDVPLNVFIEEAEVESPDPKRYRQNINQEMSATEEVLEKVMHLLKSASKPVIAIGNGAVLSEASNEIKELSEYMEIPIHTSAQGKGLVDERNELVLGATGRNGTYVANEAGKNCDLLIAFGTSFDDRTTSSWIEGYTYTQSETKIIHVDIDPREISRNLPVELGVLGDAKTVAKQILDKVKVQFVEQKPDYSDWKEQVLEWKSIWEEHRAEAANSDNELIHPVRLVKELRNALPEDGILAVDVGAHHNFVVQYWKSYGPQQLLQSWGFASMGFATCGILGAKLAKPKVPCVALVGDGSFSMHSHIMATAKEYNIPVVWVVWNNFAQGAIRDIQQAFFEGRELATNFIEEETGELYSPDFAEMAKSYGLKSEKVVDPNKIEGAIRKGIEANEPYLVEVIVDRDIKPQGTGTWELPPFKHSEPNFKPME